MSENQSSSPTNVLGKVFPDRQGKLWEVVYEETGDPSNTRAVGFSPASEPTQDEKVARYMLTTLHEGLRGVLAPAHHATTQSAIDRIKEHSFESPDTQVTDKAFETLSSLTRAIPSIDEESHMKVSLWNYISGTRWQCTGQGSLTNFQKTQIDQAIRTMENKRKVGYAEAFLQSSGTALCFMHDPITAAMVLIPPEAVLSMAGRTWKGLQSMSGWSIAGTGESEPAETAPADPKG